MFKSLILSHAADLDGVASAVIASKALLYSQPDIMLANYDDYERIVKENASKYSRVWIMDISLRIPEIINEFSHIAKKDLIIFDHHSSSRTTLESWKDKATIIFDDSGKACAADLVWDYVNSDLEETHTQVSIDALENLRSYAHSIDLWVRDLPEGDLLTDILKDLGAQSLMEDLIKDPTLCYRHKWPKEWLNAIERNRKATAKSLDLAMRTVIYSEDLGGIVAAACLSTGSTSEVGNQILLENPYTFVAAIDVHRGEISYRTTLEAIEKIGFGIDEIAKHYGGGGHVVAAGSPMPREILVGGSERMLKELVSIIKSKFE